MKNLVLIIIIALFHCSGGGSADRDFNEDSNDGSINGSDDPNNNTSISIIQDAFLKSSNNSNGDEYGISVAAGDEYVVVGTENENGQTGAAYVYTKNINGDWEETQKLEASNASTNDRFGRSIDADGDFIIVGARNQNGGEGAAYVFIRSSDGTWSEDAYLKPSSLSNMSFGTSVNIDGDTIVIGAIGESSNSSSIINTDDTANSDTSNAFSGAAFIFKRDGAGDWYQDAYLKASNSDAVDQFGTAVGVSGDIVIVSAIGEASSSTSIENTDGTASALDDQNNSGAIYVFQRTGSDWFQSAYLKPSNLEGGDEFGKSIAIEGDLIAAISEDDSSSNAIENQDGQSPSDNDAIGSGSIYIFSKAGDDWYQDAYLKTSNMDPGDGLGSAVDVVNGNVLVGAKNESSEQSGITLDDGVAGADNNSLNSGSIFIFSKLDGDWIQDIYIKASGPDGSDNFGASGAIGDGFIIVGAPKEDSQLTQVVNSDGEDDANNSGSENGAAYIFEIQ